MVPPSRNVVSCGENGCKWTGKQMYLKQHVRKSHEQCSSSGLKKKRAQKKNSLSRPLIRNEGFGVGGKWRTWVSSGQEASGSGPQMSGAMATPDATEALLSENLPTPEASSSDPRTSDATVVTDADDPMMPESQSATARTPASAVTVINAVKADTDRILQILEKPKRAADPVAPSQEVQQRAEALQAARSIAGLLSSSGDILESQPMEGQLICRVCHHENKRLGAFQYDFATGSTFVGSHLPRQFRRLKESVVNHFVGEGHARCAAAALAAHQARSAKEAEVGTTSVKVLRTAYHVLKKSLAADQLEDLVTLQHRNGIEMGNLNHSRRLITECRDVFHDVIMDKIRRHIASQPCVAVLVDKVTVARRTLDITAVMTIVPGAPSEYLTQALVIGAPVVKNHSGLDLAREIQDTLANVGVTCPTQLASIAADGQYHHLHVPRELIAGMRRRNPEVSEPACVPAVWDSAHLMNLADADARKQCPWVEKVTSTMTNITRRFLYGSGLEELRDAGTELKAKTRRPKVWSATRFAPYAAIVLQAFLVNLEPMRLVLRKRLARETRREYADELETDLRTLEDYGFLARVAALQDLYRILSKGSKGVQQIQSLPWQARKSYGQTVTSIMRMKTTLAVVSTASSTPTGAAAAIDQEQFPELWPTLNRYSAGLRKKVPGKDPKKTQAGLVIEFCSALVKSLGTRGQGKDAREDVKETSNMAIMTAMPYIQEAADLEKLRSAEPTRIKVVSIVDDFRRLAAVKLIPRSAVPPADSVSAAAAALKDSGLPAQMSNQELLKVLWDGMTEAPAVGPYLNAVIRLWLMCPPESVVESMASVVGDVFGTHRQLDHRNAAKELVIRWNGPKTTKADAVVKAAAHKLQKRFCTQSAGSRLKNMVGSVIARRKRATCPRASIFQ